MVLKIKFSRYWDKLRDFNSNEAILVSVEVKKLNEISSGFIEKDSRFTNKSGYVEYYKFNFNKSIILLFESFDGYKFSTIRSYSDSKFQYYKKNEGKVFKLEILDKSF